MSPHAYHFYVERKHFEKKALRKRGRSLEREGNEAKERGEEVLKRN